MTGNKPVKTSCRTPVKIVRMTAATRSFSCAFVKTVIPAWDLEKELIIILQPEVFEFRSGVTGSCYQYTLNAGRFLSG